MHKNIIYTSYGFGKGSDAYGQFEEEEWSIVQREKIKDYCERNNIELKVIDYDNPYMVKILNNFEPTRDKYSKTHAIYVLSAIAAIFDFCDSEYDTFYWLHLDMVIRNPDINIFDTFEFHDNSIYCWSFCKSSYDCHAEWDYLKREWRKSVCNEFGITIPEGDEIDMTCNASNIITNKRGAFNLRDAILNNMDFMNNTVSFSVIEETIIEVASMISDKVVVKQVFDLPTIGKYEGKHFPQDFRKNEDHKLYMENTETHDDAVFIHFWGLNKKTIPDFYKVIS